MKQLPLRLIRPSCDAMHLRHEDRSGFYAHCDALIFHDILTKYTATLPEDKDVEGWIECPRCGEMLRYGFARCNGHLHINCYTPECLGLMV